MTDTIKTLEKQIEETSKKLEHYEQQLRKGGENYSLSLTVNSLKSHLEDLRTQLKQEKICREKEVIEVRLKGKLVDSGDVPLLMLGEISKHFSESLLAAAQRLKLGENDKNKIQHEIIDTLDLRLAAIGTGSTRLFITGNDAPDLFGNSLIEDTLERTFGLFVSRTANELSDSASKLGKRAVEGINNFVKTISHYDLEIEMSWTSPRDQRHEWKANKEKLLQLTNSLESLEISEPIPVKYSGELIMASMKGNFEIVDDNGTVYKGTFPSNLLDQMKTFHIGERCTGVIEKKIHIHRTAKYEKIYYTLQSISHSSSRR